MTDYREVRTTEHEQGREQRVATFKATQLIWLLLGLLEAALALRVVFKLIGVNAANSFASLLYNITNLFVAPFASLTGAPTAAGMVFEFSTIIAMVIYLLIGWALVKIVYVLFYRPRGPVSVSQTVVDEHTPPQAPYGVSQTTTTDRRTTQAPIMGASQTTTTESTKTQTPGPL
jgi:uncharacterized membrane protein YhdT